MPKVNVLEVVEEKIPLKVVKKLDPKKFFKTGEGLYVWSGFTERVLSKAEPTKAGATFILTSAKLLRYATDKTIEAALPEKHVFSETEVCAVVATLVSKQSEGKEGVLLANGYANLFYTPSCVVSVYWLGGGWSVYAWRRGGGGWVVGRRVFSPAN